MKQPTSLTTFYKNNLTLIPASLHYILALQMRLEIEKIKLELNRINAKEYKEHSSHTIKKIFKEIREIRSQSNQEIFSFPEHNNELLTIDLVEQELNAINHLLHMEGDLTNH